MIANAARLLLVGGGLLAVLGSAASNPQPSYYTRKQPPQPQGYAAPHQEAAPGQYSSCQYACGQVSRCSVQPYEACITECQRLGSENSPSGRQQLDTIARMSCQQLGVLNQQGNGQQPTGPRQWQCSASGGWQKCDPQSSQCTPQSASATGVGQSEVLAREAAETNCGNTMNGMMGASFTFRTSVTSGCRAISCNQR
ncbi:MAG: hypothetical protein H0T46_03535 [Deltaproteobacteria bacterium]|nr:hypothetical protein [Deltaproteobacteria bacterium]